MNFLYFYLFTQYPFTKYPLHVGHCDFVITQTQGSFSYGAYIIVYVGVLLLREIDYKQVNK